MHGRLIPARQYSSPKPDRVDWGTLQLVDQRPIRSRLTQGIDRIKTAEVLRANGIPVTVVLDSAVSYVMEKVDFVLVGSEAVVESGGLVNAVGSNQIAIIAKAANKPFYALAERYRFRVLRPSSSAHKFAATNSTACFHCRSTTCPLPNRTCSRSSLLSNPRCQRMPKARKHRRRLEPANQRAGG